MPDASHEEPDTVIAVDSCLTGYGGICRWAKECFHSQFPGYIIQGNHSINALELLTLTISIKIWGHHLRGMKIKVLSDNMVTVNLVN